MLVLKFMIKFDTLTGPANIVYFRKVNWYCYRAVIIMIIIMSITIIKPCIVYIPGPVITLFLIIRLESS